MKPTVILHNTISLDGSFKDFDADIDLHYQIASNYHAEAYMVGSQTVLEATTDVREEEADDFKKPLIKKDDKRPFWVIVDSKGKLKNILHIYRRMPYIKDIIVLISDETPADYVDYLHERHYSCIKTGLSNVDYAEALDKLNINYAINTVLLDTGPTLGGVLLSQSIVDEISLLIAPQLIGNSNEKLFNNIPLYENAAIRLNPIEVTVVNAGYVWLRYKVIV